MIFLKNCGRGESLETTTCLRSVVGGKQGHAPSRIPLLLQCLCFVSQISLRPQGCRDDEVHIATLSCVDIAGCMTVVSTEKFQQGTNYEIILVVWLECRFLDTGVDGSNHGNSMLFP